MKKSLILLAAMSSLASAAAFADSGVTIFGTVDSAVRFVDNKSAGKQTSVVSDGLSNNRLGFRGEEDLGGGLKAGFHLETGFSIDDGKVFNGDNSRLFGRRSTLSLTSADLGELRVGRDFVPTYVADTAYTAFGANGLGNINTMVDVYGGVTTKARSDNQVAWFSPKVGGFSAHLSTAPGEGQVGRYNGGRVIYEEGALSAQAGYGVTQTASSQFKQSTVGGSYDFGTVKALASFTQGKFLDQKSTTYSFGALVPQGANGQIRASYAHVDAGGANKSQLFALGYVYNMSKRTALYSTAAYLSNSSGAARVLAAPSAVALGERSTGVEFGLRHNF